LAGHWIGPIVVNLELIFGLLISQAFTAIITLIEHSADPVCGYYKLKTSDSKRYEIDYLDIWAEFMVKCKIIPKSGALNINF
jgi:hypothetical protein